MKETDLYPPVKAFFQARGYAVKGEVGAADVVAMKDGAPPVVIELKLRFSLALFHQAVQRLKVTDQVWIAVLKPTGKTARRALKDNLTLCRRLGIGLITLRERDLHLEVHAEPGPYAPRLSKKRTQRLAMEFDRRLGDPNEGGATRHGLVTGYRQDALRCAAYLAEYGASKGAAVAKDTGVPVATRIMRDNHYGWFDKVEKGTYRLSDAGKKGLADWADALDTS